MLQSQNITQRQNLEIKRKRKESYDIAGPRRLWRANASELPTGSKRLSSMYGKMQDLGCFEMLPPSCIPHVFKVVS